jgi:hypothetical protein
MACFRLPAPNCDSFLKPKADPFRGPDTWLSLADYLKSLIDSVFRGYYAEPNELDVGVQHAIGER